MTAVKKNRSGSFPDKQQNATPVMPMRRKFYHQKVCTLVAK